MGEKNDGDEFTIIEGIYAYEIKNVLKTDLKIYFGKSKIGLLSDWYWRLNESGKKKVIIRKVAWIGNKN